jgi:peptidoglycan/LPS O-acetylase OafA/YrhL
LIYHLLIKFWYHHNQVIQAFPYLPNFSQERYLIYFPVQELLSKIKFDLGAFSVALFFLVSGFIIPLSINKLGTKRFVLRRALRIYPTYIVGFTLSLIVILSYGLLRNIKLSIDFTQYFAQISLFRTFLGIQSLDGISWTLEIEIIFYIIITLLYKLNKLSNARFISLTSSIATILSIIITHYSPNIAQKSTIIYNIVTTLNFSLIFIIFMFIGLSYYQFFSKAWSLKKFIITAQILLVNFIILLINGALGADNTLVYIVSFVTGLVVFANIYLIRDRLKYNSIINFYAEISYSLYIIHGIVSYILMSILEKLGFNPYLIIIVALTTSTFLAFLLNRFVEKPTIALGKKLA